MVCAPHVVLLFSSSTTCTRFIPDVIFRLIAPQVTDRKGWEWRLMIMPNGNSSESYGNLSVFVEHVNKDHLKDQVRRTSSAHTNCTLFSCVCRTSIFFLRLYIYFEVLYF